MNDPGNFQWLIIGGIVTLVLYLKGYLTIPQFILTRLCSVQQVTTPVSAATAVAADPPGVENLGTKRLAELLAAAAIKESHLNIAGQMAVEMRNKIMADLTAPFSGGSDPVKPQAVPVATVQK